MGEIRFVGTGETRGYPYLVCKKRIVGPGKTRGYPYPVCKKLLVRPYLRFLTVRRPPRLCFKIPGLGRFARVCAEIYNVNLRRKSLCVRLSGELNLIVSVKWAGL